MPLFSQRMGFRPIKKEIQISSLDKDTRNRLFNGLTQVYFIKIDPDHNTPYSGRTYDLIWLLWDKFLKNRRNEFDCWDNVWLGFLDNNFWNWRWDYLLDFIEFIVKSYDDEDANVKFTNYCNTVFSEESVPYRFVGKEIVPLTNEVEIEEVENAIGNPYDPIRMHFEKALSLFSDRTNPDYPNSIKESISAVECVCQIIVGRRGIALNRALKKLEDSGLEINNVLKKGFSQLYGWTSSDDGIRHAMMDLPTVDQDDARFMLVTCSAFVNYLIAEASKAGIDLASNYENIILNA